MVPLDHFRDLVRFGINTNYGKEKSDTKLALSSDALNDVLQAPDCVLVS